MRTLTRVDRLLFLGGGLLAAYQVAVGIEGWKAFSMACFTIAFGALLLAGLLLLLLGFEALESHVVVIASTVLPLSLSFGLVATFLPSCQTGFMIFALLGLVGVSLTRLASLGKIANLVLSVVHSTAGLVICFLPIWLAATSRAPAGFALVGAGGALIGLGGLLLSSLKAGRPGVSRDRILAILPGLLFTTTAVFVAGFMWH